jgi:hypothetical protein
LRIGALFAAVVTVLAVGVAPVLAAPPLRVTTSVSDRFLFFADKITARVTVVTDRRVADPASIRVTENFGDWDQLASTRTTSTLAGPYTLRSWFFDIACLQTTCLPNRKPLVARLPSVTVLVKRHDGSTVAVRHSWPTVELAPRFGPAPKGAIPVFVLDHELPAATYRVGPTPLAFGLDALAALLAAFGLWLVIREVLRRRQPRAARELPPLARALIVLRQAKARPIDDRRRAAGLLARTLETARDPDLSVTASRVAWAAPEPAPDRLEELAQRVEAAHQEGS